MGRCAVVILLQYDLVVTYDHPFGHLIGCPSPKLRRTLPPLCQFSLCWVLLGSPEDPLIQESSRMIIRTNDIRSISKDRQQMEVSRARIHVLRGSIRVPTLASLTHGNPIVFSSLLRASSHSLSFRARLAGKRVLLIQECHPGPVDPTKPLSWNCNVSHVCAFRNFSLSLPRFES